MDGISPDIARVLRPVLPELSAEMIREIGAQVPDYSRPLEGPFGDTLRYGVERALRRFVDTIEHPEHVSARDRRTYIELGRGEMRQGRTLNALLAAYRVGAQVAWRRFVEAGVRADLDPAIMYRVGEAIFAYIDEISGESIEGYAREQAAAAGEQQRRRRRLAALLVQEPPADIRAVEDAAAEAGWALPAELAAVVAEGDEPDRLAMRLGADVIAVALPGLECALVPDPDAPGRRAQLEAPFAARAGAIGPVVPWPRAALSVTRAQATLRLGGTAEGLRDARDHGLDLLLAADPSLTSDLAAEALAPLEAETEASRERLTETLAAWLRERGRTERVAAALHVHPQTVRYRLGRLRDLYGERLDDPDQRFQLELALRATDERP
jgi:hypothetical protein